MKLESVNLPDRNPMKVLSHTVNVLVFLLSSSLLSCAGIQYRAYDERDMDYIEQEYLVSSGLKVAELPLLLGGDFTELGLQDVRLVDPLLMHFSVFNCYTNSLMSCDRLNDPLKFNLEFRIFE